MAEGKYVTRKSEEDGVELWVLRNPPVNALRRDLLAELDALVGQAEAERTVRAVVLTGDGQYFSAGADLKELAGFDMAEAPATVARGQSLFGRIADLRAPVVMAINGLAVGGGLELALAGDLRVAADTAKLGATEVNFGLMPAYGGTQRLARLLGPARAKELVLTGNLVGAAEALRIGLVNKVVPSGQELRAARDIAHTIAQRAPRAVQAAKRAIREGIERSLADGQALEAQLFVNEVLPSEDLGEGLAAFLEHRPPKFTGA